MGQIDQLQIPQSQGFYDLFIKGPIGLSLAVSSLGSHNQVDHIYKLGDDNETVKRTSSP
jgi:hypothetical protein